MTMKNKNIIYVACAVAFIGIVTGVYFLGRSHGRMEGNKLKEEVETLRKSEADAAIVTRVSQQMEEIAYQQKIISDQQRDRAEQQSELAIKMRDQAEHEKTLARRAEGKAVKSAKEASEQRQVAIQQQKLAEEQRDQADLARRISDTLSYRALGRTLGYSATVRQESGDAELARLLSYASWYFLDKYEGNTYQSESFKALVSCSASQYGYSMKKFGAVNAMCAFGNGYAAVSDYGEIEIHDFSGNLSSIPVQNTDYDFRGVISEDGRIYAISSHGPLVICEAEGKARTVNIPEDVYSSLIKVARDTLIAVGKHSMTAIDRENEYVLGTIEFDDEVTAVAEMANGLILFFSSGECEMRDMYGFRTEINAEITDPVTAVYHDKEAKRMFFGHRNGSIDIVSEDMKEHIILRGHVGQILDMVSIGNILVSASYDKNILLWNLGELQVAGNEGMLTPVDLKLSEGWPKCLLRLEGSEIAVGYSDGQIIHLSTSVSEMAARILEKTSRNLTQDEWNGHIGSSVPYVTFK